ncbi:hypothetical protein EV182_006731 [Spiromyces aspiralis]|uniref:Uncharacterized protein n=1 Tax=Spiromyces aspiralis TaxID=68401 RepID=A0ACC1HPC6_9FUNG|nr:hypothetical protein EV182_006731 [Spiromyces aspiralis]
MEVREHWHLKVALAPYIPSREDPNRLVPVASLKFVKQVKHFKHQAKEAAKVAVDGDDRADDKLMDALGATDLADMNDMDENDIRDELGYTIDGLPSPPMMTTKQGNPKYKPSTKHAKATRGNKRAVLKASSKRHMGMSKSGGGSHRRHH